MISCQECRRFTSNNRAKVDAWSEVIVSATGDCKRCGDRVPVVYDCWEDWGWGDDLTDIAQGTDSVAT